MNNTQTCELKIILKADELTIKEIYDALTKAKPGHPILTGVLAMMVKETLLAAGVTDNFEVELHLRGIGPQGKKGLRLNAEEWLESELLTHHFDKMFDQNK